MKFARYLEETQTPEWKKAYIDYRGLKKQINSILADRREHQQRIIENDPDDKAERPRSRSATPPPSIHKLTFEEPAEITLRGLARISTRLDAHCSPSAGRGGMNRMSLLSMIPNLIGPLKSRPVSMVDSLKGRRAELLNSLPLHEILAFLSPKEAAFFVMLDNEFEKVESFYCAREEEMLARARVLQTQLNELSEHRNRFLEKTSLSWVSNYKSAFKSRLASDNLGRAASPASTTTSIETPGSPSTVRTSLPTFVSALHFSPQDRTPSVAFSPAPSVPGKRRELYDEKPFGRGREFVLKRNVSPMAAGTSTALVDPDRYFSARRKLKKAVLEHYRGLELLEDYRIMNTNGFRKILKKFEKHTKMPVQNQYMTEKVDPSSFASSKAVKETIKQMEEKYAVAFLDEDIKKATTRLRSVGTPQTYHTSIFRVGLYLGLAVPALIDGLYNASQPSTKIGLPSWEVLLYLYGVVFLPLMFALLVGLNLAGWASARINYVFMFELDVLSRIDHRKYFEIPAFLLCTLICSFWLTFQRISLGGSIDPTLWLPIWFLFGVLVIINPLPIMHRTSRYWFLRGLGKQFLSGSRPVEFTDFWMGDQLCSMTFTLSHFATLFCSYGNRLGGKMPTNLDVTCGTVTNMWGVELVLLCLPQAFRLIQSVKRYVDSSMYMHLVNAGKYASVMAYTGLYLKWRLNPTDHGAVFIIWCLLGVFSSVYGCAWDLFMDWSLLSFRNKKYPFLRSELLYRGHVSIYYFAIVSNTLARFSWVSYIPAEGPDMLLRTFLVAVLEILRRFQWNFFRLENEHLGNVDQYRVTREVPLPYSLGTVDRDDEEVEHERVFWAKFKNFKT